MLKAVILCLSILIFLTINLSYAVVNPSFDFHFGSFGTGNGQFKVPEGVTLDSSGNIYVADTNNHRIQKFNSTGTYLSKFGATGTGNGQLRAPSAMAIDSSGNIYVADTNNNRIQKFNSAGTYLSKFGATGTGNGQFRVPNDIAIDSSGNIYVADTNNNRIQKFNSAGTYLLKFGSLGSGNGQFNAPSAIALDSAGNIYVADSNNNRIQKFDSAGTYVSKFGATGTGNGQFNVPQGIFVDAYNNIMISDTGNHRIQKFDSSGTFVLSFGTFGTGENQLNYPQKITMSGLRGFVADTNNNRIYSFYFPESPVADNQRLFTLEETPISLTLTASDANNDSLTYSIVSQPANGTLSGVAPSLTYTPNVNSFGTDSFTFKANDGDNDSNVSTIEIDIGNINDNPTSNAQSVTTNEDASLAISATATDADNDTLAFIIVNNVQYGTISGTLPNVTYTPNLNYFGSDSFSFKVNDGMIDSNTSTVSITINTVNDAPMAYDVNATLNEDTTIYTSSIPYQQTDIENDPVSFIIISMLSNGTLSGDPNNLLYTPNQNYYGTDCLTFKFNDGEFDSNVATACAIILPVNDAPVADDQAVQTDEDIPLSITLTGSDVENDTLSYEIISQPSYGDLSGTAPNLVYTPDQNHYNIPDSLSFRAFDGADYSNTATISITINPVNDPPTAYSMNFTTPEDTPFVNAVAVAYDIENATLSYILTSAPTHGSLSGVAPSMTYTPDENYFGPDSLTFKVNDGELDSNVATLYMEVGPVNDQPITYPQSITTNEDVSVDITLTALDDIADPLTYTIITSPSSGSLTGVLPNVTYVPDQNNYGSDSFSFKVNDGLADSNTSTVSITINPVNDPPTYADIYVTMNEDTPILFADLDIQGNDAENDPVTHIPVSSFSHITYSGSYPNFSLIPETNYFGSDEYVFKLNDGQVDSDNIHTYITILPVNDAPVADDQQITMSLNNLQSITLTGSDIENDTLSYQIVSQPEFGILFGIVPDITYLPNRNYVGTDEFTFRADDGNTTSIFATVSLTITQIPEETTDTTTGDSGSSTIDAIPKISKLNISTDKSENSISYDFTGSSPNMLKATTGEKINLQVTLDDAEASKRIIHFGLYTNLQKPRSDIKSSNAYVIFDMGLPLKVVDIEGIFKDVQLNTLYQGKSMIVDIILTFDKPMKESDIILEVWNQGRHPTYQTIPSVLAVTEPDMSGPNISGLVTMPEETSKEPIRIFSTAGGKVTEIKNNGIMTLKNKDVGIKISGFIEDAARGDKVNLLILRPDDSVHTIAAYLNDDNSYNIVTKLHTKWISGFYEILVSYNEKEQGKIRVYVTDKELPVAQYPAILDQPEKISIISQYIDDTITKENLISYLQDIGWSESRIDEFIANNKQVYVNPYTFYILASLIPLLYVLVSVLSKKKTLGATHI